MINKCKICGVPLEGFGYRLIARPLFGIKPGKKKGIPAPSNKMIPAKIVLGVVKIDPSSFFKIFINMILFNPHIQ